MEYADSAITLNLEAIRASLPPGWENSPHMQTATEYRLMALDIYKSLAPLDKAYVDDQYKHTVSLMNTPIRNWPYNTVERADREVHRWLAPRLSGGVGYRIRRLLSGRRNELSMTQEPNQYNLMYRRLLEQMGQPRNKAAVMVAERAVDDVLDDMIVELAKFNTRANETTVSNMRKMYMDYVHQVGSNVHLKDAIFNQNVYAFTQWLTGLQIEGKKIVQKFAG